MVTPSNLQAATAQRMYNARAPLYDDSWHPSFAQNMLGMIDIRPGDQVLDLACGTGLVTALAAESVGAAGYVLGIDISDGMLSVAAQRCNEFVNRGSVKLCHHSITELASLPELARKEGSFDVISCASAIVLLTDPVKALKAWTQYLKPGTGRLVFDVILPSNQPQGLFMEQAMLDSGLETPYHRTWATGEPALREVIERVSEDGTVLQLERIVFMRQQAWDKREHDGSEQEALTQWDHLVASETFSLLRDETSATREAVKRDFVRLWIESGGKADGNVIELDGVYVVICTRGSEESDG